MNIDQWVIPLSALFISMATLIFAAISLRGKQDTDHAVSVERRIERVENELKECLKDRARLERENLILLRDLIEHRREGPA